MGTENRRQEPAAIIARMASGGSEPPQPATSETRLDRPIFVVGCGRSGTTVLGEALGAHPDVVYLNEPRELWAHDPRANIWSPGPGVVVLTCEDLTEELASGLRSRLEARVVTAGRSRLAEKTPINSFRIGYLDALCPDALFVHVIRDGRAVAASIANIPARGRWYGKRDAKWHRLAAVAEQDGLADLVKACGRDRFRRGLLEWRLAVTHARRSLESVPPSRWAELRYEDLVSTPASAVGAMLTAVGLRSTPEIVDAMAGRFSATKRSPRALDGVGVEIAGVLLAELGY
jgi:hypothetical protein